MNKEYIEREAATAHPIIVKIGPWEGPVVPVETVNAVPAADVLEVRHGQWLTNEYVYGDPDVGTEDMWIDRLAEQSDYYAYCSICGKAAGYNGEGSLVLSDYCPHCGAKMMKA